MLKGRSNYLCLQRARGDRGARRRRAARPRRCGHGRARAPRSRDRADRASGRATTETGDRAELDFEPRPRGVGVAQRQRRRVPGRVALPEGRGVLRPRRPASGPQQADVIVVNTHLYGVHLASGGHSCPTHEVVVFDEAHELEDIVASAMGVELDGVALHRARARSVRSVAGDDEVSRAVDDAGLRLTSVLGQHPNERVDSKADEELAAVLALCRERLGRRHGGAARGRVRRETPRPARGP